MFKSNPKSKSFTFFQDYFFSPVWNFLHLQSKMFLFFFLPVVKSSHAHSKHSPESVIRIQSEWMLTGRKEGRREVASKRKRAKQRGGKLKQGKEKKVKDGRHVVLHARNEGIQLMTSRWLSQETLCLWEGKKGRRAENSRGKKDRI